MSRRRSRQIENGADELARAWRARQIQRDGPLIRLNAHGEAKKSTTESFCVHDLRDAVQDLRIGGEVQLHAIRQILPLRRATNELCQQTLSPGFEGSGIERTGDRQI